MTISFLLKCMQTEVDELIPFVYRLAGKQPAL